MQQNINVPFQYEGGNQNFYAPQVRERMLGNERGVVLHHIAPNRAMRRFELQRTASNNRKAKEGVRAKQRVPVTIRKSTKWGEVVEDTGFFRTVIHKLVPHKVMRNLFITGLWGRPKA